MANIIFFLPLLLLLILVPNASPTTLTLDNPSFPSTIAKQMIRDFNLFPQHSVNIVDDDHLLPSLTVGENNLVEKRLKFPDFVDLNGVSVDDLGHHAGYYQIEHSHAARMFYFFFESRGHKTTDPVVIWLTGGPGCSSELALFYENGPFKIAKNSSLVWNEYGWDQASNLLFVDQPIGTGFSYSSDKRDIRHNEQGVSDDLYDFLQAFFKEHPEFAKNDFYITGESYAGHYIPAFAARVHAGNKAKEGIHINLKGFAIGNGLTDPLVQYKAYTDYALDMGIIKESDHKSINKRLPVCETAIKLCGNSRWVHAMEWSGQKQFGASPDVPFEVDGSEAGLFKTHGPLSFLKVNDAGHMVPMDQPKAALSMLKRWTKGSLSESGAEREPLVSSM
ncbi:hypothetical protein M8C21_022404 [Ambrosia artemisiifolia]|uniref:Carboxypeptidase n=1 Tax=Ambrosia artemisiifolia TaxID=4212 RepID=A0AAD5C692_AMBAR|nr:hypothetical protein M8C21_022404 [Ambrosia artemisiifolia]